jgi:hypothetical protein
VAVNAPPSKFATLMKALFAIVEPRDQGASDNKAKMLALLQKRKQDKSVEARLRNDVRIDALKLVMRLFNARLDKRISLCVELWENVFDKFQQGGKMKALTNEQAILLSR